MNHGRTSFRVGALQGYRQGHGVSVFVHMAVERSMCESGTAIRNEEVLRVLIGPGRRGGWLRQEASGHPEAIFWWKDLEPTGIVLRPACLYLCLLFWPPPKSD